MIKKFLSLISKGADGRDEAILPTTYILRALEACYLLGGPSSKAACIFDVIYLVLQMIYRCSKYCHDNPTSQYKKICKVPNVNLRRHLCGLSHHTHQFLLLLYVGILPLCVLCWLPFQSLLSKILISIWQRRHWKYPVMDLMTLPGRQIILLYPPHSALSHGLLNVLRPRSPHSYLLLPEYESSYFPTWLCIHQKPTQGYHSGVPKS